MILIISLVKFIELKTNTNFAFLGVFPKNIEGFAYLIANKESPRATYLIKIANI